MVLKLSQLRNFKAVVEAGAVRQAAKTLNLSQSSITKKIGRASCRERVFNWV